MIPPNITAWSSSVTVREKASQGGLDPFIEEEDHKSRLILHKHSMYNSSSINSTTMKTTAAQLLNVMSIIHTLQNQSGFFPGLHTGGEEGDIM